MTEEGGRVNHIWMCGEGEGRAREGGQWGEKYSRDNLTPFIGALEAIYGEMEDDGTIREAMCARCGRGEEGKRASSGDGAEGLTGARERSARDDSSLAGCRTDRSLGLAGPVT